MCENDCCCECEPLTVGVGMDVPDFTMDVYDPENRAFGKVSLDELKKDSKWTVLVFYPADFTFVCPTELADLAEKHETLKKLGAEVICVSTDPSSRTWPGAIRRSCLPRSNT